jgi:hypothetical protein
VYAKSLAPTTAILRADVVPAARRARRGHPTGTKQHNNNTRHVSNSNNSTKTHINVLISNAIINIVIINNSAITNAAHDMQQRHNNSSSRVLCALHSALKTRHHRQPTSQWRHSERHRYV